jgi:hypothetical protein
MENFGIYYGEQYNFMSFCFLFCFFYVHFYHFWYIAPRKIWQPIFLLNQENRANIFDVMITIFCNCRQFLVKKLAFFSKTNIMIKILQNLAFVSSQIRQFFR